VAVRRKGLEDSVAQFQWTITTPGSPRQSIVSDSPQQPWLTAAAAVMLAAVLLIAAFVWLRRPRPLSLEPVATDRDVSVEG
jgi:hypothetical protein